MVFYLKVRWSDDIDIDRFPSIVLSICQGHMLMSVPVDIFGMKYFVNVLGGLNLKEILKLC